MARKREDDASVKNNSVEKIEELKNRGKTFSWMALGLIVAVLAVALIFNQSSISNTVQASPTSATIAQVPGFVGSATTWIRDVIKAPFEALGSNQTDVLRFFFFILVFLIISVVVSKIPLFGNHKGISILVALIVAILGVFFIPDDIVKMMINPYSAMGIAMISIIPFILMFLFTQYMLKNSFFKKIAWFFFAAMLLILSIYSAYQEKSVYGWTYGIVSILALIMLFAHKWIDAKIWHGEMDFALTQADKRLQQRMVLDQMKEREAAAAGIPGASGR